METIKIINVKCIKLITCKQAQAILSINSNYCFRTKKIANSYIEYILNVYRVDSLWELTVNQASEIISTLKIKLERVLQAKKAQFDSELVTRQELDKARRIGWNNEARIKNGMKAI